MSIRIRIKEIILEIEYLLIITLTISVISQNIRNYLEIYYICLLFVIYHELAHILIATLLNKKLQKILISISGLTAYFKYEYKEKNKKYYIKDIAIFLAGPFSNIIMAMAFKDIKFIYEINMFLAFLNLLPIYPLDGYNILKATLHCMYKNSKFISKISKIISLVFLIVLSIILIIVFLCYRNITSIIFVLYMLLINIRNG